MACNPTLDELIELPFLMGDLVIKECLLELVNRDDSILFVCHVNNRSFIYFDPLIEKDFGYHPDQFILKGADRMIEMMVPAKIPKMLEKQIYYSNQVKMPGFDPRMVQVQEYETAFITSTKQHIDCFGLAVTLTFTQHAELGHTISLITKKNNTTTLECIELLKKIKARHNEIFVHEPFIVPDRSLGVLHASTVRLNEKITKREEEVLLLLANGDTTKQIANKLSITEHTVETHRKHLLKKLDAKNTAELVKKASKVFWL
jgi:DNA-binding CsgD family transcriptional regulator